MSDSVCSKCLAGKCVYDFYETILVHINQQHVNYDFDEIFVGGIYEAFFLNVIVGLLIEWSN